MSPNRLNSVFTFTSFWCSSGIRYTALLMYTISTELIQNNPFSTNIAQLGKENLLKI